MADASNCSHNPTRKLLAQVRADARSKTVIDCDRTGLMPGVEVGARVNYRETEWSSSRGCDGTVRYIGHTGVLISWDDGYESFLPDELVEVLQ